MRAMKTEFGENKKKNHKFQEFRILKQDDALIKNIVGHIKSIGGMTLNYYHGNCCSLDRMDKTNRPLKYDRALEASQDPYTCILSLCTINTAQR